MAIVLDVYSYTYPTTHIATLDNRLSPSYLAEIGNDGGGSFNLSRFDPILSTAPTLTAAGNIVQVTVDGTVVGAWIIQTVEIVSIAQDEGPSEVLQISGPGLRTWLSQAEVYPAGRLDKWTADTRNFNFASLRGSWYNSGAWATAHNMSRQDAQSPLGTILVADIVVPGSPQNAPPVDPFGVPQTYGGWFTPGYGIYGVIAYDTALGEFVAEPASNYWWDASADGFHQRVSLSDAPASIASPTLNCVQQIDTQDVTGGQFQLIFNTIVSGSIPWNATSGQVQSALEALSNIGSGNVAVIGGPGGFAPFWVAFQGSLAGVDQPVMAVLPVVTGGPSATVIVSSLQLGGNAGIHYAYPALAPPGYVVYGYVDPVTGVWGNARTPWVYGDHGVGVDVNKQVQPAGQPAPPGWTDNNPWRNLPSDWPDAPHAKWMWDRETRNDLVGFTGPIGDVYFRREFTITGTDTRQCSLFVTADDGFKAYIDGQLITSSNVIGTFYKTQRGDVTLDPGDHVIAIKGSNGFVGPAGVLCVLFDYGNPATPQPVLGPVNVVPPAVILAISGDTDNGGWVCQGYPSSPPGWTIGAVLGMLFSEAQARGVRTFQHMSKTFTDTHDSAGISWPAPIDWTFDVGTGYDQVVKKMEELGCDVAIETSGPGAFFLSAWGQRGSDKSGTVVLQRAVDVTSASQTTTTIASASPNVLLLKSNDGWQEYNPTSTSQTQLGRIEGYLSVSGSATFAQLVGSATITKLGLASTSADITYLPVNKKGFVDFFPGDIVSGPSGNDGSNSTSRRVMSITVTEDADTGFVLYASEFNTVLQTRQQQLQAAIESMIDGSLTGTVVNTSRPLPPALALGFPPSIADNSLQQKSDKNGFNSKSTRDPKDNFPNSGHKDSTAQQFGNKNAGTSGSTTDPANVITTRVVQAATTYFTSDMFGQIVQVSSANPTTFVLTKPAVFTPAKTAYNNSQTLIAGGSGLTSFTLTFSGQTTTAIAASATASTVATALAALPLIGSTSNVTVGGTSNPANMVVTFIGTFANQGSSVPTLTATPTGGTGTVTIAVVPQTWSQVLEVYREGAGVVNFITDPSTSPAVRTPLGNSIPSAVQTITITGTPTGGTFTLTYSGQTTTAIAFNATASTVQSALVALSNIGTGQVTVTGGPGPGTAWVATFGGTLAQTNVTLMTHTDSLTGGTTPAAAVATTTTGGLYLRTEYTSAILRYDSSQVWHIGGPLTT